MKRYFVVFDFKGHHANRRHKAFLENLISSYAHKIVSVKEIEGIAGILKDRFSKTCPELKPSELKVDDSEIDNIIMDAPMIVIYIKLKGDHRIYTLSCLEVKGDRSQEGGGQ